MKELNNNSVIVGGDQVDNQLYTHLSKSIKNSDEINIIVSFLKKSGVRYLEKDLLIALNNGAKINLVTSRYLGITDPEALYLLNSKFSEYYGNTLKVYFYQDENRSFHPKAYFFKNREFKQMYIGSSNISHSALTTAIEWNYVLDDQNNLAEINNFEKEFFKILENESIEVTFEEIEKYAKQKPQINITKIIEENDTEDQTLLNTVLGEQITPKPIQYEILEALNNTREDGAKKALVQAATGIGKTYLAAFDSLDFEKILFVAHREEILKQAKTSFQLIHQDKSLGFFNQEDKSIDVDIVFASVATLGKEEYLNDKYFDKDYFDYIIIDEFHHAAAKSYQKIINYFKPKFMLSLTATPERLDGRSIYELCDYNVPYIITLQDAIERDILCPFDYRGIYDLTTNYDQIKFVNGKYDETQLTNALINADRKDLILKHYLKYNVSKTIGFCSSKRHVDEMTEFFNINGIKASAVYSDAKLSYSLDRNEAITKLNDGDVDVIFCVDMFNEGVDIPGIDMVMFLRPTESPTIFLQQLGRGLRKSKDKTKLLVLDFIGNYKKAEMIPSLLSGKSYSSKEAISLLQKDIVVPKNCLIDFDFQIIDIFQQLAKQKVNNKNLIIEEYQRIKNMLNHVPSRVELLTEIDEDTLELFKNSQFNPFKNYLKFIDSMNDLSDKLKSIYYNEEQYNFLRFLETTGMTKSYKLPVLLAFYNDGDLKQIISEDDLFKSFKKFYEEGANGLDLTQHKKTSNYVQWTKEQYLKLAYDNPIHFLLKSHPEFVYKPENGVIALVLDVEKVKENKVFMNQMYDILKYREINYYRTRFQSKYSSK